MSRKKVAGSSGNLRLRIHLDVPLKVAGVVLVAVGVVAVPTAVRSPHVEAPRVLPRQVETSNIAPPAPEADTPVRQQTPEKTTPPVHPDDHPQAAPPPSTSAPTPTTTAPSQPEPAPTSVPELPSTPAVTSPTEPDPSPTEPSAEPEDPGFASAGAALAPLWSALSVSSVEMPLPR
jgi:outer membrane biosynthesis protein TonB